MLFRSEDRKDEIVQRIRQALQEALSSSDDLEKLFQEIQEEGYKTSLGLALMITLTPEKDAEFLTEKPPEAPEELSVLLTSEDKAFLSEIKIDFRGDE